MGLMRRIRHLKLQIDMDMVCYMHYTPISHNIKTTDDEEVNYTNHSSSSLF